MDNKYLFGAIGVLLVFIAGIGLYSAVSHPQETAAIPQSAVGAVGEAVSDATSVVTNTVSTEETSSGDNDANDERGDDGDDDSRTSNVQQTQTTPMKTTGTFTMAQVKTHNSATSCYTTINGSVYDLTSWISQHPGGARAILSLCGIDGTQKFQDQHGGQARPEQELASLKIGTLSK